MKPAVLNNFIAREHMLELRDGVQRVYNILFGQANPEDVQSTLEWGGLNLVFLQNTFPGTYALIGHIAEQVALHFPGARLVPGVSAFRRIVRETYIFWHMDADGTGSAAFDPVYNFWFPLEDVGDDYPSVEIMPESEAFMRSVPLQEGYKARRADSWVNENLPNARTWAPHMKIGDVFIFSHYILHRTQPLEHLKGPRIGLEARFSFGR